MLSAGVEAISFQNSPANCEPILPMPDSAAGSPGSSELVLNAPDVALPRLRAPEPEAP